MTEEPEDISSMLKACENIENQSSKKEFQTSDPPSNQLDSHKRESGTVKNSPTKRDNNLYGSVGEKLSALKQQSDHNLEILRKLKLVKSHKHKNNLETLDKLIKKWRSACQDALTELLEYSSKQPQTTMGQLIEYLGIDPKQISFNTSTNTFAKELEVKR